MAIALNNTTRVHHSTLALRYYLRATSIIITNLQLIIYLLSILNLTLLCYLTSRITPHLTFLSILL